MVLSEADSTWFGKYFWTILIITSSLGMLRIYIPYSFVTSCSKSLHVPFNSKCDTPRQCHSFCNTDSALVYFNHGHHYTYVTLTSCLAFEITTLTCFKCKFKVFSVYLKPIVVTFYFLCFPSNMSLVKLHLPYWPQSLHKRWRFSLRISSVNVTKCAISCGFGHI